MEKDDSFINGGSEIIVIPEKSLTKRLKLQEARPYMSADYINSVLNRMPPGKQRVLCQFLWMTGVRISEALVVRKRDVDLVNMVIEINWLKSRRYVRRNIPVHPALREVLFNYIAGLNLDDFLFPFSRQRAYQITKRWFGRNPHAFRHSFAVNWLRCGGDITVLSRYLGHARLQETAEYLKIVPVDQGKELMKVVFG